MTAVEPDWFHTELAEIRVAEAFALLVSRLPVVAAEEQIARDDAEGRILAGDIRTPIALPPFDHAAVDGYALRFDELEEAGGRLRVLGRVAAGGAPKPLAPSAAMRIFTGAPLPAGADTVVMQEDVRVEADHAEAPVMIVRSGAARPGRHIRRKGEELAAGSLVLSAGRRLGPAEFALLASLGLTSLAVRLPLKVALLSTGDELIDAGGKAGPGKRHDSNRPMLAAMLRRLGCQVTDCGIVADERQALEAAFSRAVAEHQLILASGGASAGEEDHVRAAIGALGVVQSWTMAMKPGRHLALGTIRGVPIIGLPGNPVAAMNAFLQVARAAVLRLAGAEVKPLLPLPVPADFSHTKRAGRREALRVKLQAGGDGRISARLFGGDSSGWLTSLTEGDGLAVIGEDEGDVTRGMLVGYLPFFGLF